MIVYAVALADANLAALESAMLHRWGIHWTRPNAMVIG